MARHSQWSALYPIPVPGSQDNAGLHSWSKSKWRLFSYSRGIPDYTHFILPPTSALLFVPLTFLSYFNAYWVWTFFLTISVFIMALISSRLLRYLLGQSSRWEGALMLLIVLSPMTARAIRIVNVSPLIALLFSLTIVALIREQAFKGAGAMFIGGSFKYATLVIAPLLIAMRRWRMILWLGALGLGVVFLTVGLAGIEPFIEFKEVILPTLSRPSAYDGNQSLSGLLARTLGRPLPKVVSIWLNVMRLITMVAMLGLLFRVPKASWRAPVLIMAATAMWVSWLFMFSPISWEHWPIFLCPVWGWLLWEGMALSRWRYVSFLSLGLMYFPAGIFQVEGFVKLPIRVLEPFNSFQLVGVILVWVLANRRLRIELNAMQTTRPLSSAAIPAIAQSKREKSKPAPATQQLRAELGAMQEEALMPDGQRRARIGRGAENYNGPC